jgi:hypothetical protein
MILQQTSAFLMRVLSQRKKTELVDLAFAWEEHRPALDEQQAQRTLRLLPTLQALLQDLFRTKYANAKAALAHLLEEHPSKAEALLHFHPQAGNDLALSYGSPPLIQPKSTSSQSSRRESRPLPRRPTATS